MLLSSLTWNTLFLLFRRLVGEVRHTAIKRGWLELHESGTYVKFTQSGADLFV
jgi:hypothetical protein